MTDQDDVDDLQPCKYFDMMAGTSTGGYGIFTQTVDVILLTINLVWLLSCWDVWIGECSSAYDRLAKGVFARNKIVKAYQQSKKGAKYDKDRIKTAIKQIISERPNFNENSLMLASQDDSCKV